MAQSYSQVYLHLIFSTKYRQKVISPDIESKLYAYIGGIIKKLECQYLIINGTEDHVHFLIRFSRKISIAKLVMEIKKGSSVWIKTQSEKFQNFKWQTGYGIFSVSPGNVERTKKYIADQKNHHTKESFKDEYLSLLNESGIEYDEKYIWE